MRFYSFALFAIGIVIFASDGIAAAQQQYTVPQYQAPQQPGVQGIYPPVQNFQVQSNHNSPGNPQSNVIQQHWTQQIASENRAHNFGTVPSFSKQEHVFEIKNPFEHPLYLIGVRASCGCTKPSLLTNTILPGETGKVMAKYDTKNFRGDKKATISVSVRRDQPYYETGEIQFKVTGNIRRDVVVTPETVAFTNVTFGETSKRTVQILYAGNPNWKIEKVTSSNPNIKISTKELQRNPATRRVDYELILELGDEQKVGSFLDQIVLTTNDTNNKTLAVNVNGNVHSVVQVAPVKLGVLTQDQKIEKRLIVRGTRPFAIENVASSDARIQFSPSSGSKTLHILTYSLDTSMVGQIKSSINIATDDPNQKSKTVSFEAQVVPATFALDDMRNQK